jgi:MipA family protein
MTFKVRGSKLKQAGLSLALLSSVSMVLASDAQQEEKKSWQVTLGAGVANLPEYPGSEDNETRALPLINVRYKRFFFGGVPGSGSPGGLGLYAYDGESFSLGAVVAPGVMEPREESDDASLRGLGDIEAATRAGLFSSYRIGWLTLSASALTDVSDKQQGMVANFDAQVTYRPTPKLSLSLGPGLTWADEEYMQTFFGITPQQAVRSAFAPYTADAGISVIRVSFGVQYLVSPHWFLGGGITAARLQGDAADSPIVMEENQNLYALFAGYRF